MSVSALERSTGQVIEEIAAMTRPAGFADIVVFDADGTLWASDIGLVIFEWMIAGKLLRPPVAAPVAAELERAGEAGSGDVHRDAWRLLELYREDRYPEAEMCALMAWCLAGHDEAESRAHFAASIEAANVSGLIHDGIRPLIAGLRSLGKRVVVVSASPAWGVEAACGPLGFTRADVRGVDLPLSAAGVVEPRIAGTLPFREGKVHAIRGLTGGQRPLVVLGDSTGDLPMLADAALAIAVQPRPAVLARAALEPDRWRILRFSRTESGLAVVPPDTDRVVV